MSDILKVESTLTDRYQTTVPETVCRALQLGKRDKIHHAIRPGGEVVLMRAEDACVHLDGQLHSAMEEGDRMIVRRARETITLLHPQDHSHYAMLREKLKWG